MTDTPREPSLSPYDEGTDSETESFLLDAQDAPEQPAQSPTEAHAVATPATEPVTRSPWPATPDDPVAKAEDEPHTAVLETSPTDTVVRRTSLLHLDDDAPAAPLAAEPTPAPAPVPAYYAEYSDYERAPSRAAAHWWSLLSVLILTPVAWYLLADAGARFTLASNASWVTGELNYAALIEFAAGLLVLVVVILALRSSSLGAWVTGPLLTLGGAAFIAVPEQVQSILEQPLQSLSAYNAFGANLSHHLVASGSTGRLLIMGIALIAIGFVSHGARRRGRRDQRIDDALRYYGR